MEGGIVVKTTPIDEFYEKYLKPYVTLDELWFRFLKELQEEVQSGRLSQDRYEAIVRRAERDRQRKLRELDERERRR